MPLNNIGFVVSAPSKLAGDLWRCAQPDKDGFKSLEQLGITVIVKLNSNDEYPNLLEQSFFSGRLIVDPYPRLFKVPSKEVVLNTVTQIRHMQEEGDNVAVHCTHGIDRTGLVIGAYRIIFDGWNMEQVQAERYLFGASPLRDIPDHKIVELLKSLIP